ncbi:MAG: SH3 domain-containing protein [Planctomycetota bacterium]|nr:MAG: SH3 domain-containing protein [Planctomycetota bacterium]
MRRLLMVLACLFSTAIVQAEIRRFPYEAVVKTDAVPVRSGPGKNFYATSQLPQNAVVIVHRHDPGGWYMIAPPEGSYSWIRADQVRIEAAGSGVVDLTSAGVEGAAVWVGSEVEDAHSVRGRVLAHGDAVAILSEDQWTTTTGAIDMLRIAPTAREFRWVKGDFLVPRDATLRQETIADPYANPLATVDPVEEDVPASLQTRRPPAVTIEADPVAREPLPSLQRESRQTAELSSDTVVRTTTPRSIASDDPRAALREIDSRYNSMMELEPAQWDIDELIRAYKGLAEVAPQLSKSIEQRVVGLESHRELSVEYRSFIQLTSQTNERDQQLATQGQVAAAEMLTQVQLGEPGSLDAEGAVGSSDVVDPTALPVELNGPEPLLEPTLSTGVPESTPELAGEFSAPRQPTPVPSMAPAPMPAAEAPLVGAGIVRKLTATGQPARYGLVSPQGKVLAVLQGAPAELESAVGQAMGFVGDRKFDPQLRTDLLKITRMMPVQLQK